MKQVDTIVEAVQLMEDKKNDEAIALLEKYVNNTSDENKFAVADIYIQWGFLDEAVDVLDRLLRRYPDESEIKIMLAEVHIELENDQEAIQLLDSIPEEDPLYLEVLLQLADLYQSDGLFEVAEAKLIEAKKKQADEPVIDFALGELLFSIGEYNRSIVYYEKLLPDITELASVSINTRLAEAYAATGKYEKALAYFQKIDSNDPDTLFKYGFTAYYANRKDIAINIWKKLIEQDENYHSVYYELAKAYQEEGMLNEAYKIAEKGLEINDFSKELYFYAGKLAHQLNKVDESENYIRQAIVLDYDYLDANLFLIELLKEKDAYEEIISFINEIIESGAEDPLYRWELARVYTEEESYEKALNNYQEAYNGLSKDSEFLKEYGYFLTEDGKVKEALPIFEAYVVLEPSDMDTLEYMERLKENLNNI